MNMLKRVISTASVLALISAFSVSPALAGNGYGQGHGQKAKNVIILIPDGCSQSIQTLARWYKGEDLTLDALNVGVVKHEMANSVITGSAAAATAFSTGYKTTVRFLSIGPREDDVLSTYEWPEDPETFSYKPLATVMEGANLKGMATGLISTSRFTHATPAAWACHVDDRGKAATEISEQMVYNEIDLIFGGGGRNLDPGYRPDGENLEQVLMDRGYEIAKDRYEMEQLQSLPAFGMFAWSHMDAEIDRPIYNPDEPSLADMTQKAIDLLSQDKDGFILMVEGSQVDWAGHNNDPIYMVTDFIEFDEAVQAALDFARQDGNTLVLAYPDHNTGGMDIGNRVYNGAYTHLTVEELLGPLNKMDRTFGAMAEEIAAMPGGWSAANIQTQINELWDLEVSDAVAQEVIEMTGVQEGQDGYTISPGYALARVISKHCTAIGWTSHGHNAEDVPLWAYGPGAPQGLVDNTELAETVADVLGLNMTQLQNRLFVSLDDAFGNENWILDETNPDNPVAKLSATLSGCYIQAELPINKDLLTITATLSGEKIEKEFNLEGVVVYAANTGRVYVPRQAVMIMKTIGKRFSIL